jgi:tRNA threonylcarbamoyladenosine biosynthesis protein TsaE
MIVLDLPDETATADLAARISALAEPADVIALKGELGTGKTSFARAFIRARGERDEIPSPTFTLVQIYDPGSTPIWHFDLYRLRTPDEAWELGIEDAFASGISLVEWPERMDTLLPKRRLEITFIFGSEPGARRLLLDPSGDWRQRLAMMNASA